MWKITGLLAFCLLVLGSEALPTTTDNSHGAPWVEVLVQDRQGRVIRDAKVLARCPKREFESIGSYRADRGAHVVEGGCAYTEIQISHPAYKPQIIIVDIWAEQRPVIVTMGRENDAYVYAGMGQMPYTPATDKIGIVLSPESRKRHKDIVYELAEKLGCDSSAVEFRRLAAGAAPEGFATLSFDRCDVGDSTISLRERAALRRFRTHPDVWCAGPIVQIYPDSYPFRPSVMLNELELTSKRTVDRSVVDSLLAVEGLTTISSDKWGGHVTYLVRADASVGADINLISARLLASGFLYLVKVNMWTTLSLGD